MKYYETDLLFDGVVQCHPIEVERETSVSVWVNGIRRYKLGLFKTKAEIKQYHINRINGQIAHLSRQIAHLKNDLEKVEKFETKEI